MNYQKNNKKGESAGKMSTLLTQNDIAKKINANALNSSTIIRLCYHLAVHYLVLNLTQHNYTHSSVSDKSDDTNRSTYRKVWRKVLEPLHC